MALDTKDKRLSMLSSGQPWQISLPTPSGEISQGDRQQLLSSYSGLLWRITERVRGLLSIVMSNVS